MTWTAPDFTELKMDAEIGSYQEGETPFEEPSFVNGDTRKESAAGARQE